MENRSALYKNKYLTLIFAGEEQRAPDSFYGPIARCEYILHYVLGGEGYVQCGGKTIKVGPEQTFLFYPDELVRYYADNVNPWHYIWVNFAGEEADRIMAQTAFTPNNRVTPPIPLYTLYPYYQQAVSTYSQQNEFIKNANLHVLLAQYTKLFPLQETIAEKDANETVVEYIQNNFMYSQTSVATIAERCNISRSQLFRICKNLFSCSPIQYLTSLRLDRAKYWLENTDHPVSSIASSVGFEDSMYFSRLFTEKIGVPPSEYRRQFRNKKNQT